MAVGSMPTFVASNVSELTTASTDMTVPLPAEVQPGDMMVVYVKNNGSNATTVPATPSGWTYLGSSATANYYHIFWRFRVAGGDPEPTFIMPVSAKHQAHVLVYRNVGGIGNFTAISPALGTYTYSHPSVATVYTNSVVIYARDFTTTAATGSWAWTNAVERTDNALTYASGLTNLFSTASVEMPSGGTSSGVQSVVTGGVSNGSTRATSFVLHPVTDTPTIAGVRESGAAAVTTTSITVDLPTEILPNDIIVIGLSTSRSTSATYTVSTPTGLTKYSESRTSTSSTLTTAYTGVYASGDPTSITFDLSPSAPYGWVATAFAIRGGNPALIVAGTPFTQTNTTSAATIVIPSVTTVSENNLVIGVAGMYQTANTATASWPTTMTKVTDAKNQSVSGRLAYITTAYEPEGAAGATGTRTVTYTASNVGRYGILLAIPPAPAASYNGSQFLPFFVSGF